MSAYTAGSEIGASHCDVFQSVDNRHCILCKSLLYRLLLGLSWFYNTAIASCLSRRKCGNGRKMLDFMQVRGGASPPPRSAAFRNRPANRFACAVVVLEFSFRTSCPDYRGHDVPAPRQLPAPLRHLYGILLITTCLFSNLEKTLSYARRFLPEGVVSFAILR